MSELICWQLCVWFLLSGFVPIPIFVFSILDRNLTENNYVVKFCLRGSPRFNETSGICIPQKDYKPYIFGLGVYLKNEIIIYH